MTAAAAGPGTPRAVEDPSGAENDPLRPEDDGWMRAALALGRQGAGRCAPNPAVGCVLVRGGRLIARARTADGGRPHAEAAALAAAGGAARGATAYVTLEPCAHMGRGGPCADALVAAGIARAVVAMADPDPRTAGRGLERLRAAGIAVTTGVRAAEAARDHAPFLTRILRRRPRVTLKLAASLDGRIATAAGESRWITGPEARRHVHALRLRSDAVMVGAGTARADDPDLTARGMGAVPQPLRVVLSRRLDVPPASRLGRTAREVPVLMVHGPGAPAESVAAWEAAGASCHAVEAGPDGDLPPAAVLAALGAQGVNALLVEGGGGLAASLLSAGLVDELHVFSAGLLLGADGLPCVGPLRLAALADAPRWTLRELRSVGADALHVWTRG